MKKVLLIVSVIIILFLAFIYIFIPATVHISQAASIHCTPAGAFRFISDQRQWAKWWPHASAAGGPNATTGDALSYNNDKYQITQILRNTVEVRIHHDDSDFQSTIRLVPLPLDSVGIEWECSIRAGLNPFRRVLAYQQAKIIFYNMAGILHHLQSFAEDKKNVYGFDIKQVSTKDTFLVTTKAVFSSYPSTANTYQLINKLKDYIDQQDAKQTGYPIINITQLDTNRFQVITAVPVNKQLTDNGPIFFTRMVPGQFLAIDVKGGPSQVQEAVNQLHLYFSDYQRTSMAIPFQALITDRVAQPDTLQWNTRIYQPVY